MRKEPCTWVLLADSRQGRLLQGTRTHRGSPHFEEVARVELETEVGRSHGEAMGHEKPGHRNGVTSHEARERLQRGARQLASWLHEQTTEQQPNCTGPIHVFAPPRLSGALHRYATPRLRRRILSNDGDYGRLSTGQLAQHPRFRHLVPELRSESRQNLGA